MSLSTTIPRKSNVEFAYRFERLEGDPNESQSPPSLPSTWSERSPTTQSILLVFINGLALPMAGWSKVVELLRAQCGRGQNESSYEPLRAQAKNNPRADDLPEISIFLYDRYGQGESRLRNPDHDHGKHDLVDSARDLIELLDVIITKHYDADRHPPKVILVAHSIGVPLARIFTSLTSPSKNTVSAILMLDSNMTNTDFVSIYPDPDAPDFDPSTLPPDTTVDALRLHRARTLATFHPSVPNCENLDRESLLTLLPDSSTPTLFRPGNEQQAPFVTVVGHDPEEFAEQGFQLQGTPRGLNLRYMSPFWDAYNRGLLALTTADRARGIVVAKRSGHFVQRDRPDLVVEEAERLIRRVGRGEGW